MKQLTMFKTLDGSLHESEEAARRHAGKVYGLALTKHAHALVALDWKYTAVCDYLDTHADELARLVELRDDMGPERIA